MEKGKGLSFPSITRCFIFLEKDKIKLINRRNVDITYRYPELDVRKNIKANEAIIDGEIVVLKNGKPDFYLLQEREHVEDKLRIEILSKEMPATYIAFDILYKDGKDLKNLPLIKRKKILEECIIEDEKIMISEYVEENGIEFFKKIKEIGLEGIIAKKKDSIYEMKRSKNWLKIKVKETVDCIICGFTEGKGQRKGVFGALILGMYHGKNIVYVGKVGTGFDEKTMNYLYSILLKNPGKKLFDIDEKVNWVKPIFVCEIESMGMTKDKKFRAPSFKRLRFDKDPKECILEV